jgi:hypothetical protein
LIRTHDETGSANKSFKKLYYVVLRRPLPTTIARRIRCHYHTKACFLSDCSAKLVIFQCTKGTSNANYSRQLLKAIERVDGLVTSDEKVRKLMLDREAWRRRINMIVAANKEEDFRNRKNNGVIRRRKTRSAIAAGDFQSGNRNC